MQDTERPGIRQGVWEVIFNLPAEGSGPVRVRCGGAARLPSVCFALHCGRSAALP
jgi:hypothetical protein